MVTPGGSRVSLSTVGKVSVLLGAGSGECVRSTDAWQDGTRDDVPDAVDSLVRLHAATRSHGLRPYDCTAEQ